MKWKVGTVVYSSCQHQFRIQGFDVDSSVSVESGLLLHDLQQTEWLSRNASARVQDRGVRVVRHGRTRF